MLASRDALTAFFARLGYDTNYRLVQSAAAMNITGDALTTNIRHIERIASQDGGLFEVYLFELTSVTVAATQAIVRAFRNRPGDYLLVLTDDYERLDFVLAERYTQPLPPGADQLTLGIGARTAVGVRTRVLTVQRRNPDQVALRVRRRFSFTESDTFAQDDKLISAYDMAEWSKPYFNNRALFSDYYLTERLVRDPAESASMTRAYREVRSRYAVRAMPSPTSPNSTAADVIGAESAAGATVEAISNRIARGRSPAVAAARRGSASCVTGWRSGTPATRTTKEVAVSRPAARAGACCRSSNA